MKDDIQQLLNAGGGVISRRAHPHLTQRLDRLKRQGELEAILPGTLIRPAMKDDWRTRVIAGLTWLGPDAVLAGYGAARLTFWPDCTHDALLFIATHPPRQRSGFTVLRGRVEPEWIRSIDGVRLTEPAYAAVQLATTSQGGDVIDRALRSERATLPRMWEALRAMPHLDGNGRRRALLQDSRDKPWSELERAGHRLLRTHRLTGWCTNAPVSAGGQTYRVDVLFRRHRLVIEFDGYAFHTDHEVFEKDRRRRNELVLAGYLVLNFTWAQVIQEPDWVIECIRRAITMTPGSVAAAA